MPSFLSPFDALVEYFQDRPVEFHADASAKSLELIVGRTTTVYRCHLRITHSDEILQIDVKFPVRACGAAIRPLAAEMVARANYGLVIGRLDMDMSDGEIAFHIGHLIGESGLDDENIGCLFRSALNTSDRYFGALMRLIYGGHTPGDAVYVAELDMRAERADAGSDA
jgi:hypothetical protein